jgi:hypothetical protein
MDVKISESIEKLKQEKRIIANKLLELSQRVQNSFAKMEKKNNERFALYENKLAKLEKEKLELSEPKVCECAIQVTNINSIVEKHSDDVSKLEQEYQVTNMLIKKIDTNLEELDNRIESSNKIIEDLKKATLLSEPEERKQCIFDRTGYCREKEKCLFLHTDDICEFFQEKLVCWKKNCIKRHPRICRYFQRDICRRENCRYLHKSTTETKAVDLTDVCYRCERGSYRRYFCEFCSKNFCANCTSKEAHVSNIYNQKHENPSCSDVHY